VGVADRCGQRRARELDHRPDAVVEDLLEVLADELELTVAADQRHDLDVRRAGAGGGGLGDRAQLHEEPGRHRLVGPPSPPADPPNAASGQ
jgi:hypothetical protein